MRRVLILPVLLAALALGVFWLLGGFDQLGQWAAGEQRDFQNRIARALRALRGGEAGALSLLMLFCFAYGVFHAIGPGHGKVLIGGYGLGRQVPWLRLSLISLLASLGQAVTAVVLVTAGMGLLTLGRERMVDLAEDVMAPASYLAIVAVGLWLIWRGARGLMQHEHGAECSHRHGPAPDQIARATGPREALALIGGIAIRPCTGAIFVLIITWQMGIAAAGIAGAFAMALGTATVTIAVGLGASALRGGFLAGLAESPLALQVVPMIEILAGLMIAGIAGGVLLTTLS